MFFENKQPLIIGLVGGSLAGFGLCQSWILLIWVSIAFLWSVRKSLLGGFFWGCFAVLYSHSWVLSLHPLGWIGVPDPLSLPIAICIWLFFGVMAGIFVCLWCLIGKLSVLDGMSQIGPLSEVFSVTVLSCFWGFSEVFLAHSPLFWIGLGGSVLPGDRALAGLARWFGAGGLATLQLLIGFWLWHLYILLRKGISLKKTFSIGFSLVLVAHLIGFSLLDVKGASTTANVAIWQTNIPVRKKFSKEEINKIPLSLEKALNKAKDWSALWLIAPEGTLIANQDLIKPAPIPLLSGGFRWVRSTQRSSLLVFEKGQRKFSKFVDKYRLVPIGERVPNIPFLSDFGLSAVGGIYPGDASRFLSWSGPPFGAAICYEISDGYALAKSVNDGAQWLLSIANLDPYPQSLQKQFVSISQLRSIENGRDLIIAANTGPSSLILATGEVRTLLSPFEENLQVVKLNLRSNYTIYSKWRELPLLCVLLVGVTGNFYTKRFKN